MGHNDGFTKGYNGGVTKGHNVGVTNGGDANIEGVVGVTDCVSVESDLHHAVIVFEGIIW